MPVVSCRVPFKVRVQIPPKRLIDAGLLAPPGQRLKDSVLGHGPAVIDSEPEPLAVGKPVFRTDPQVPGERLAGLRADRDRNPAAFSQDVDRIRGKVNIVEAKVDDLGKPVSAHPAATGLPRGL